MFERLVIFTRTAKGLRELLAGAYEYSRIFIRNCAKLQATQGRLLNAFKQTLVLEALMGLSAIIVPLFRDRCHQTREEE